MRCSTKSSTTVVYKKETNKVHAVRLGRNMGV